MIHFLLKWCLFLGGQNRSFFGWVTSFFSYKRSGPFLVGWFQPTHLKKYHIRPNWIISPQIEVTIKNMKPRLFPKTSNLKSPHGCLKILCKSVCRHFLTLLAYESNESSGTFSEIRTFGAKRTSKKWEGVKVVSSQDSTWIHEDQIHLDGTYGCEK